MELYYKACENLAKIVMNLIGMSLEFDTGLLYRYFESHTAFIRLNLYEAANYNKSSVAEIIDGETQAINDAGLGISRHTDAGAITILLQDNVAGLEVYSGSKQDNNDGEWLLVEPVPGTLTVNTGDMVQIWSNNRYKAAEHRVRASTTRDRYSIAFFYNPSYDAVVEPLKNVHGKYACGEDAAYVPVSWGAFRRLRFMGDYSDLGEEVQIEHYRTGDRVDGNARAACV